jgi:hypothetical protein
VMRVKFFMGSLKYSRNSRQLLQTRARVADHSGALMAGLTN